MIGLDHVPQRVHVQVDLGVFQVTIQHSECELGKTFGHPDAPHQLARRLDAVPFQLHLLRFVVRQSRRDQHGGLADCFEAYVAELERLIGDGERVTVMPGVGDLVRALAARDDAVVGLLTGNIEPGARVKLRPTRLWPLFRVGAFGSDDMDRRRLLVVACERAHRVTGRCFAFEEVTIIGDTPLDVDCARACGARAVAVATGFYGYDDLQECGPDVLLTDLGDVDSVLALLAGSP